MFTMAFPAIMIVIRFDLQRDHLEVKSHTVTGMIARTMTTGFQALAIQIPIERERVPGDRHAHAEGRYFGARWAWYVIAVPRPSRFSPSRCPSTFRRPTPRPRLTRPGRVGITARTLCGSFSSLARTAAAPAVTPVAPVLQFISAYSSPHCCPGDGPSPRSSRQGMCQVCAQFLPESFMTQEAAGRGARLVALVGVVCRRLSSALPPMDRLGDG
jgi:hypothetical protein